MRLRNGFILCVFMMAIVMLVIACGEKNPTYNTTENTSTNEPDVIQEGNIMDETLAPEKDKISEEEARDVALKHAGHTLESVNGLRTQYEYDDGVPEYEVRYYYDNMEYEYTIHAESGEILEYDWDN